MDFYTLHIGKTWHVPLSLTITRTSESAEDAG